MGYGSGKFPIERASKLGHMKVIEHEHVSRLLRQFEKVDTASDNPVGGLSGRVDLTTPSKIKFIITIDGGQAVIPNAVRRDKRMAFIKFCAMLIRRDDITALRKHPIVDPRDMSKLFEDGVWTGANHPSPDSQGNGLTSPPAHSAADSLGTTTRLSQQLIILEQRAPHGI